MPDFPIHGSIHFDIREWVDPVTWDLLKTNAQWLIDPTAVRVADLLREKAGAPIVINNWHFVKRGQQIYRSSGFRPVWDRTGGKLSQHRRGAAFDAKVVGFSPSLLVILIQKNRQAFVDAGLTTIENIDFTPTWLHCDVRPRITGVHPIGDFLFVDPI